MKFPQTLLGVSLALCPVSLLAAEAPADTLTTTSVVRLDTEANEIGIWVAYPGKISHVCGIVLKAASALVEADALAGAIELNAGKLAPAPGALLAATLWQGDRTIGFGALLTLKTKSGDSFASVVYDLIKHGTTAPDGESTLLVAEARPCQ